MSNRQEILRNLELIRQSQPYYVGLEPQQGLTVWLTGLSGSGKTTLALAVLSVLRQCQYSVHLLDADEVRSNLYPELGYTKRDREVNTARLGYLAQLLSDLGVITIVAATSPYRSQRTAALAAQPVSIEVFVDCPLSICEARDPKGLYKRYRAGQICGMSGIDDVYEPPLHPRVQCLTAEEEIEVCVNCILEAIIEHLT